MILLTLSSSLTIYLIIIEIKLFVRKSNSLPFFLFFLALTTAIIIIIIEIWITTVARHGISELNITESKLHEEFSLSDWEILSVDDLEAVPNRAWKYQ